MTQLLAFARFGLVTSAFTACVLAFFLGISVIITRRLPDFESVVSALAGSYLGTASIWIRWKSVGEVPIDLKAFSHVFLQSLAVMSVLSFPSYFVVWYYPFLLGIIAYIFASICALVHFYGVVGFLIIIASCGCAAFKWYTENKLLSSDSIIRFIGKIFGDDVYDSLKSIEWEMIRRDTIDHAWGIYPEPIWWVHSLPNAFYVIAFLHSAFLLWRLHNDEINKRNAARLEEEKKRVEGAPRVRKK